jgi:1-acyl-sn-glycerol-3-phosphate acyltransferase
MSTYIMLSRLTDEGRKTLKERPERLEEVRREVEGMGARVTEQLALLGEYDFLNVIEAPDNETITDVAVELGSRGTISIETLPAIPVDLNGDAPAAEGEKRASYAVFARLTGEGRQAFIDAPERLSEVTAEARRLGANVRQQFRTLGDYDYVTLVDAPDNATAQQIATEVSGLGTVRLNVFPAIALKKFVELMQVKAYSTDPHEWQTSLPARAARRVGRYWTQTRHVRRFARPLSIEGRENLKGVRGPALIIANHTSHFDTPVVLHALPEQIRSRTAIAAAADRFYRTTKRSWWYSLFINSFPIKRGGGMAALDYPMKLLNGGWSILIFPEGGRFKPGQVQRFKHGPTIMAMHFKVPVIPVYLEGLHNVMPKGQRTPKAAEVHVRLGKPISLEGVESVPDGTAMLEQAMRDLAGTVRREEPARQPAAPSPLPS